MVEVRLEDISESSSIISSRIGKDGVAVEDWGTSEASRTLQGKAESSPSITWKIFEGKNNGKWPQLGQDPPGGHLYPASDPSRKEKRRTAAEPASAEEKELCILVGII